MFVHSSPPPPFIQVPRGGEFDTVFIYIIQLFMSVIQMLRYK
jgi:hypothetical protein